jgi:hypothetical protein
MLPQNPGSTIAEARARTPNTLLEVMRRQPVYCKANRFAVTGSGVDVT